MKAEIATNAIYDIKETSKILGVSVTTLRKMIKKEEIPYKKVMGKYKFCGWQIKEWFDKAN